MKRIIIALLLLLSIVFALTACGERIPAKDPGDDTGDVTPGGDTPGGNTPGTDPGDGDGDGEGTTPEEKEDPFTVTVMLDGKPYVPPTVADESKAVKIRWTDGETYHTAVLGSDGKASIADLDGDYTVTILNLPDDYIYNPNINKTDNDNKNISIDIMTVTDTYGAGTGLYKCIYIKKPGAFRANIKKAKQVVYYEFIPTKAGLYYVESMVDISTEMYNPILKVYTGTSAAKFEQNEIDDGGISGTYTKNFRYVLDISDEIIGNSFTFAIRVEGKDAVYPTCVDFSVVYAGAATDTSRDSAEIMIPEYIPSYLNYFDMWFYSYLLEEHFSPDDYENPTYKWMREYEEYLQKDMEKFGYGYKNSSVYIGGMYVFQEDFYRLNPDDGYYHVYDEVKYALNGGWGPILYADITNACQFMEDSLSTMEYRGNKALTVSDGTENYKLFIEGSYELTLSHGDSGPYFCNNTCPCYKIYEEAKLAFSNAIMEYVTAISDGLPDIQNYVNKMITARENVKHTNGGMCDESCTDCNPTCRHLPEEHRFQMGYANISVGGRAPVTEELKIFLQKLSESQRYFADGNGWVEEGGYTAFEDSQWLFACGYYTGGGSYTMSVSDLPEYPDCNEVALISIEKSKD